MDAALQDSITHLLLEHEIGGDAGLPYRLSFAAKGQSGASFGATQGDLNTNAACKPVFRRILGQRGDVTGFSPARQAAVFAALIGKPNPRDPFQDGGATIRAINLALGHPQSRPQIDAMDQAQLAEVCAMVDGATAAAAEAGHALSPAGQVALALYCNQFGAPTTVKAWLRGEPVMLDGQPVPPAPAGQVGLESLLDYIGRTKYYRANPKNFQRFCAITRSFAANLPKSLAIPGPAGPPVGV